MKFKTRLVFLLSKLFTHKTADVNYRAREGMFALLFLSWLICCHIALSKFWAEEFFTILCFSWLWQHNRQYLLNWLACRLLPGVHRGPEHWECTAVLPPNCLCRHEPRWLAGKNSTFNSFLCVLSSGDVATLLLKFVYCAVKRKYLLLFFESRSSYWESVTNKSKTQTSSTNMRIPILCRNRIIRKQFIYCQYTGRSHGRQLTKHRKINFLDALKMALLNNKMPLLLPLKLWTCLQYPHYFLSKHVGNRTNFFP